MFSSRMFTILALFFGAFTLFASAGPIGAPTDVVAPRGLHDNELVPRGGQCNSPGCNEQALLDIIASLELELRPFIALLDGHHSPNQPCHDITIRIQTAVGAILALDVNVSGSVGPLIGQIVILLAKILNGIIGGCGKYGLLSLLLSLVSLIDITLAGLVNACCHICPGLLTLLLNATLGVTWNLLGFLLTFVACGH